MPAPSFCCPKWQQSSWVWLPGAQRTGKLIMGSGNNTTCLCLLNPVRDHRVISDHAALERCGGIKASIPCDWHRLQEHYGHCGLSCALSEGETA